MTKRQETGICEACGKKYKKCRFNKHVQKYCTEKKCVTRRRQERQRQGYRSKYRKDKSFAEAERERCKIGLRKGRKNARKPSDEGCSENPPINIQLFAKGLLSQWIDSKDPLEVEQEARRLERRGQQLTLPTVPARGSPNFINF